MVPTKGSDKATHIMLDPINIYGLLGTVIVVLSVVILRQHLKTRAVKLAPAADVTDQSNVPIVDLQRISCHSSEEQTEGIPDATEFVTPPTITWSRSGNMRLQLN